MANEVLNKEIKYFKQQLELLEEDKKELEEKWQSSEEKARRLKESGKIYIFKLKLIFLFYASYNGCRFNII